MFSVETLPLYFMENERWSGLGSSRQTSLYAALIQAQSDLEHGVFVLEGERIVFVNDALSRITGYEKAEFTGLAQLVEIIAPEYRAVQLERYEKRRSGESVPQKYEIAIHHKSGRRVEIEVAARNYGENGQEPGVIVMLRDITEQKRAEADLRDSENRFRTMADAAPLAIWLATPEGNITYCNRAWLTFTGRSAESEHGGRWQEDIHPEDRPAALAAYYTACRTQTAFKAEYRAKRRDGKYRWLLANGKPQYHDDGTFKGLIGTCVDINERKMAEMRREQTLQENARLLEEIQASVIRQRLFIREILDIVTEGTLHLCESADELPVPFSDFSAPVEGTLPLDEISLRHLRRYIEAAASALDFPDERCKDLITAAGEAAMNTLVHGGGSGQARVLADRQTGRLQVWIHDKGEGIAMELLHKATLQRGYSSAGTLGYGFWIMVRTCETVYLLTGPEGTTIVLEQGRDVPLPGWLTKSGFPF
jgi:PAS domain S-box-containing protein